jgi:hypothetical protein
VRLCERVCHTPEYESCPVMSARHTPRGMRRHSLVHTPHAKPPSLQKVKMYTVHCRAARTSIPFPGPPAGPHCKCRPAGPELWARLLTAPHAACRLIQPQPRPRPRPGPQQGTPDTRHPKLESTAALGRWRWAGRMGWAGVRHGVWGWWCLRLEELLCEAPICASRSPCGWRHGDMGP